MPSIALLIWGKWASEEAVRYKCMFLEDWKLLLSLNILLLLSLGYTVQRGHSGLEEMEVSDSSKPWHKTEWVWRRACGREDTRERETTIIYNLQAWNHSSQGALGKNGVIIYLRFQNQAVGHFHLMEIWSIILPMNWRLFIPTNMPWNTLPHCRQIVAQFGGIGGLQLTDKITVTFHNLEYLRWYGINESYTSNPLHTKTCGSYSPKIILRQHIW